MFSGTFTSNYAGMQYRVEGLGTTVNKRVRITVTDVHTDDSPDLENPANATGAGSGSFHLQLNSHAKNSVTFDIVDDAEQRFNFVKGTTYRAVVDIDFVPTLTTDAVYIPIPAADSYTASVNHSNSSALIGASPATGNPDSINAYVVTIYPSAASVTGETLGGVGGDNDTFVWQQRYVTQAAFDADNTVGVVGVTAGVLAEQNIDGTTADKGNFTMGDKLNNQSTYEVIVVAENDAGLAADAITYHLSPRDTPNDLAVFTTAVGVGLSATGDSDDKFEFSAKCGAATGISTAPHDQAIIVKLSYGSTVAYKKYALGDGTTTPNTLGPNSDLAIVNELIDSEQTGWKDALSSDFKDVAGNDVTLDIADGETYTLNAYAINAVGPGNRPGVQATATPSGLPEVPVVTIDVGGVIDGARVNINSAGFNETTTDNGAELTKYEVSATGMTTFVFDETDLADAVYNNNVLTFNMPTTNTGTDDFVNGSSYDLTVTAFNANGSTSSAVVSGVVPRTAPTNPAFVSAAPHINVMSSLGTGTVSGDITELNGASQTGGDEQITYVFSLVDNTNGENITDISDISGVGVTSAVFTGLNDGSKYTMSVQAINSFSEAGPVSVYGTKLVPSIPPTVNVPMSPDTTNLVVTASHNKLEVNPTNLSVSTGGYPTVGMKVHATNVSGSASTTVNILLNTPAELFSTIIGDGARADHEYILTFTPYNAVYQYDDTDGVGYTPAPVSTTADSHAHATNTLLFSTPTFDSANTTDGGKLSYTVTTPNWESDGNWQYTRGTTISYIVSSCAPTQATAGGLITYPGDGDTYTAPTEEESQNLVAGTDNTINLVGLRNGTRYKIAVTAHSREYHDEDEGLIMPADPPSSVEGNIPYTKPTISWTNAAGTTTATATATASNNYMRIASNGSALDDTIMINSLSNVDNLGVVSHKAALLLSTEALYGGTNSSIAVPFTDYITSTGSVAQLYSKSQRSGTNNNYILITENLAGASIDISGQVVGVNNTSSN